MSKSKQLISEVVKGIWSANQLLCIARMAEPSSSSQKSIAEELGINNATISKWKRLDGFLEDVQRVADYFFIEYDMQVDRACLRNATLDPREYPEIHSSITKSIEVYYKRRGLLIDKKEISGQDGGAIKNEITLTSDLTDEQTTLVAKSILSDGGEEE